MTRPAASPDPALPRPSGGRQRLSVDERRAQLLALGLEFFTSQAYDAVAIDDIARTAGISKGLLYHYFPTKRDFYVATVRAAADQLLQETAPPPDLPVTERLIQGLDAFLDYVERREASFSSLLRGGIGADAEVVAIIEDTRNQLVQRVADNLESVTDGPLLRVALRGWLGFVEAASLEWLEQGKPDRPSLCRLCVAMLQTALQVGDD